MDDSRSMQFELHCPKCNQVMNKKGSSRYPIASGTASTTVGDSFINSSGSALTQDANVYLCPNCGYEPINFDFTLL